MSRTRERIREMEQQIADLQREKEILEARLDEARRALTAQRPFFGGAGTDLPVVTPNPFPVTPSIPWITWDSQSNVPGVDEGWVAMNDENNILKDFGAHD